ncbi:MAG: hypothetical protein AB1796_06730, partial [Bacillota bacterium]
PALIVDVKAIACQLPRELGVPLSRLSIAELHREVTSRGITAQEIFRKSGRKSLFKPGCGASWPTWLNCTWKS